MSLCTGSGGDISADRHLQLVDSVCVSLCFDEMSRFEKCTSDRQGFAVSFLNEHDFHE